MQKNVYFSIVNNRRFALTIIVFLVVCSLAACHSRTGEPLAEEPEVKILQTDSFHVGEWVDVPAPDTLGFATIVNSSFDLQKLPSRNAPFLEYKPFASRPQEKILNKKEVPFVLATGGADTNLLSKPKKLPLPKPLIERVALPNILQGTTSSILQLSDEEGLNGNLVNAAVEDGRGSKWFSTEKGLSRYEGDVLLTYQIQHLTPQGSLYPVSHLKIDHQGRVWMITCMDGVYILDPALDSMTHMASNQCFSQLVFDQQGTAWLGNFNDGKLLAVDEARLTYSTYALPFPIFTMEVDKKDRLWLGCSKELVVVDSARKGKVSFSASDGLLMNAVTGLAETADGEMWMSSIRKAVYKFRADLSAVQCYDSSLAHMVSGINLVQDKKGSLWALDDDTLMIIRPKDNTYRKIYTGATLLKNFKTPAFVDRYGVLWLGTIDKGFLLLDTEGPMVEILDSKSGLSDGNVWGFAEDTVRHLMLIPTRKGLDIYDRSRGKLLTYANKDPNFNFNRRIIPVDAHRFLITNGVGVSLMDFSTGKIKTFDLRKFRRNYYPLTAYQLSEDRMVLNLDSGMLILRMHDGYTTQITRKQGLPSNLIWFMQVDDNKKYLWLGTDSGLVRMDSSLSKMLLMTKKSGLAANSIQRIEQRKNKEWVIAMQGGISLLSEDFKWVRNITDKHGLRYVNVYDLLLYHDRIFAGTQDGLYVINLPDTTSAPVTMRRYAKRQGFPLNDYNQNAGIVTSFGQLWWGVTPNVTILTSPLNTDTIPTEVKLMGIRLLDQRLNLNQGKGDHIADLYVPKGVTWDSLSGETGMPAGLRLPHNVNTLNIDFNTDDVRGRDQIVYSYYLDGEDTAWSKPGPLPTSRTYFNLSSGKYTFYIKARGVNGIWSSPKSLSFEVLKPWWFQWWALLMYVAALALFTMMVSNFRSRMLKRENSLLEQRVNERTVALEETIQELKTTQAQMIQREKMASLGELTAGIAHEIQNPLNFVNNFSEVNNELLSDLNTELDKGNLPAARELMADLQSNNNKINQHGKRADSIIKSMLQHSRSSAGEKELTDINALADEYLQLSYHGMRAKEKDFNAKITTSFAEGLPKTKVVPQDLGRVLMNLLNNAFYAARKSKKFGDPAFQPEVIIKTEQVKNMVMISITDNGDGIPEELMKKIFQPFFTTKPTGEGTGLGLSLSFDIVTKGHNGQLNVQTKQGVGTTFLIQLPVL